MAIPTFVYVGTYTGPKSKGIYLFRLQTENLEVSQNITLVPLGVAAETPNPSFIELDLKRRVLFAANELNEFEGKPTGAVSAFSIAPETGRLTFLNQRPSMGTGPCHLALDRERRHLLVANYGSGSVSVLPVASDGRLGAASDVVQHAGKSVHPERQKGPHAHCVTVDPANRFVFACDLGLDKVLAYRFDAGRGKLTPHDPPFAQVKPGAGPRHMVFRPDGRFAYVVNELTSTITSLSWDAAKGRLAAAGSVSSLPAGFSGENTTAEIAVHPNGRFLYGSNRGNDSIAVFAIAPTGTLTLVEHESTRGKEPRNFAIDPSGKWLIAANQKSDNLAVFSIDQNTGALSAVGALARISTPVCVLFL